MRSGRAVIAAAALLLVLAAGLGSFTRGHPAASNPAPKSVATGSTVGTAPPAPGCPLYTVCGRSNVPSVGVAFAGPTAVLADAGRLWVHPHTAAVTAQIEHPAAGVPPEILRPPQVV